MPNHNDISIDGFLSLSITQIFRNYAPPISKILVLIAGEHTNGTKEIIG